ncbi:DME family drug/metabolite transporter [Allonocardiopsis opalescens]|uniref:DME family drug/metabolite transporter n=1 Tax=Allonocardiopsis opalescens TaxID=1144618 RepID=A0A2T0QF93_9ACTN|nr:DME family drug/metabolite transporter [Allonocardiopsis opalescens]
MLWGTGGVAGYVLQRTAELHPLAVAAYRLLLGGLAVTLVLAVTGRLARVPLRGAVVRRLLAAGALLGLYQAAYFASVSLLSVSLATLVTIGSVPVFVTAGMVVLTRRRPAGRLLAALLLAVAGLVLLAGAPGLEADGWGTAAGVGAALLAGLGFAVLTLLNRTSVPGLDALGVTGLGCLVGGALLLGPAAFAGLAVPATAASWAAALYLGAVPTALAYVAYFSGLRTAPTSAAALAVILEPLTATVLGVLLLGDRLSTAGAVGALLLAAAVAVEYAAPRRRRG